MASSGEESDSGGPENIRKGGDYEIPTYLRNRKETIPPKLARNILEGAEKVAKDRICNVPPQHPTGGEVYLFCSEGAKDFKADAYQWHSSGGGTLLPRSSPKVNRHYERLIVAKNPVETTNGFTRIWYRLVQLCEETGKYVEREDFTLIQYLGDHTLWRPLPHGNEKEPTASSDYKRTAPSLLDKIKKSRDQPQKVYGELLAEKGIPPTMKPRDKRQITNHQQLFRTLLRATNDEICNVVLYGLQLKDFVRQVVIDLPTRAIGIYMISGDLVAMIKRILTLPKIADRGFQVQYDTTFKVGHFYLSVMSFRHPSFTNYPAIPFAFLIHTRKYEEMHHRLFQFVKEECPKLGSSEFVFVTDREFRDVRKIFPKATHVYCWKHIESDIEVWVRSHRKAGNKDSREPVWYGSKVVELMHSENEDEFGQKLTEMKKMWSKGFIEYFDEHVKPDILAHANRWLLDQLGVYRGGTYGITTNPAEGLNTMIKSLHRFKSTLLIDQVVVSLHFLCKYFNTEEQRGRAGEGNWRKKLCDDHHHYALASDHVIDDDEFKSPEEIVKFVIESATKEVMNRVGVEAEEESSSEEEFELEKDEKIGDTKKSQRELKQGSVLLDEPTNRLDPDTMKDAAVKFDSQRTAALELVRSQKIKRVQLSDRSIFVVEGSKTNVHAVSLKPKESCTCPATRTCYHILAARLMEGQPLEERQGTLKLSQIMFKARKRNDRKTVKEPRKNDYLNVIPAPDSMLAASTPKKRIFNQSRSENALKQPSTILEESSNESADEILAERVTDQTEANDQEKFDDQQLDQLNVVVETEDNNEGVSKKKSKTTDKFCYCNMKKDAIPVQCSSCLKWYHADTCVDVPQSALDETAEKWNCPTCSLPVLVPWGGKFGNFDLGNTCSIDNAITLFGLYFFDNPESIDRYLGTNPTDPAVVALKKSVRYFIKEMPIEGRAAWIEFLLQSENVDYNFQNWSIDIYGMEENRFYNYFTNADVIQTTSTCSSDVCSRVLMEHQYQTIIIHANDALESLINGRYEQCHKRTKEKQNSQCEGIRKFEPVKFINENSWMLVLEFVSCTFEKILELPKSLKIDKSSFKFGGVTVNTGDHFTLIFDWHGRRFYYNAMSRQKVTPLEFVHSRLKKSKPNIAVYFKDE